jgi:hypothetical protein
MTHDQLVVALLSIEGQIKRVMDELATPGPLEPSRRVEVGFHLKKGRAYLGNALSAAGRPEGSS